MDATQTQQLINIVTLLALAVVGLATAGMTGLVLVIRQNKAQAEMIWQSIPLTTQQTIRPVIQGGKLLFDTADEIVDPPPATGSATKTTSTKVTEQQTVETPAKPALPAIKPEIAQALQQIADAAATSAVAAYVAAQKALDVSPHVPAPPATPGSMAG